MSSTFLIMRPIDWRNGEAVLRETLLQVGFRPLDRLEVQGMVRMLGWKGRDPGAEVDAVTIIREDYDATYDFDRSRLVNEWINPADIPPCDRSS